MEAGDGIEPSHGAFAEPGLTTWLPRRFHYVTQTTHNPPVRTRQGEGLVYPPVASIRAA